MGAKAQMISGRVLTGPAMDAHNTFERPEAVKPAIFTACGTTADGFTATLPAKSVVVLEID